MGLNDTNKNLYNQIELKQPFLSLIYTVLT